jgi:DNA replication protein DnaC
VFIGPPGVGKSHLSTAIGMRACEQRKTVLFKNAIELVDNLFEAYAEGTLKAMFRKLSTIDLLIIDDLGYLKMNKEKESIFFQLIRQRYEKSSLIITTNLPFNRWDEVFTSEVAATAVLDRLLHHCHVISITGNSYRVKNN